MIEAKDFRAKQAKGIQLNNTEALEEVAQKVKNTLGFLLCAYLTENKELDIFYNFLIEKKHPFSIIFHMERDTPLEKTKRPSLLQSLKIKLNCLEYEDIQFNIYDAKLLDEEFDNTKDWWYVDP